jgi:hypothetical protein
MVTAISRVCIFFSRSPEPEIHRYFDQHVDWRAMTAGRRESPQPYRVRSSLIQPRPETLQHTDATDSAVGLHDHLEHDLALDVPPTGFFGVLRLDLPQDLGRCDPRAGAIRPSAGAAAAAGADSGTRPFTGSGASSAAAASAVAGSPAL